MIFFSPLGECALDANDLFEHFQSDENSSSISCLTFWSFLNIVCNEKLKSEKRKTLCPFYMKLLLEVFWSKQTSAAEGSILILAARKVKVAFSDNVWQKSQNPEQQQPSLFVRKKTGGRNWCKKLKKLLQKIEEIAAKNWRNCCMRKNVLLLFSIISTCFKHYC